LDIVNLHMFGRTCLYFGSIEIGLLGYSSSGFPYNKVVTKTLYLLVLDYDRFSRDDPIGEVCLPLSELDLGAGLTLWKTLMPCKGAAVCTPVNQRSPAFKP